MIKWIFNWKMNTWQDPTITRGATSNGEIKWLTAQNPGGVRGPNLGGTRQTKDEKTQQFGLRMGLKMVKMEVKTHNVHVWILKCKNNGLRVSALYNISTGNHDVEQPWIAIWIWGTWKFHHGMQWEQARSVTGQVGQRRRFRPLIKCLRQHTVVHQQAEKLLKHTDCDLF